VVGAAAKTGADLLQQLLGTDEGAGRLGEVALVDTSGTTPPVEAASAAPVGGPVSWQNSGRLFYHPLLDENSANHIALGESYGFCLRSPDPAALNRSLIHVDLPLNARVTYSSVASP